MKKILIPIILQLILQISISAQTITQTIRGRIVDKESQIPLTGATIIVDDVDSYLNTISDLNGYYKIDNVTIGRHTIKISFIQ